MKIRKARGVVSAIAWLTACRQPLTGPPAIVQLTDCPSLVALFILFYPFFSFCGTRLIVLITHKSK